MHRFHLAPNDWLSAELTGSEARHAGSVLRLGVGDRIVLFDGRGREATAEIRALELGAVRLRILQETITPPLRAHITLAQAIPKGKNMDLIVQKAVEIGAAEIYPLLSARTVVQLDPEGAAQKQAKWQTVALEAAKQCGQNWLPQIHRPRSPNDFFALHAAAARSRADYDLRLIGSLQPGARHLKKILTDYAEAHDGARPARVLMLIGPEGDFTPAEIGLARSQGCLPLTLGPIILRVETAAIYCLSILSYELLGEG
ncbi:MAG TPA: 16S rRNA (uracil(1498)-N(3))-methyltransferase [Chthoniobacterales bacterium]|jgi:16S rRNA (uracil1498-N3)-methyltransferase|nr:16S rRNA (uracil(1498)-N(3))-methyltransferase [Chthoniobacterales bacterium]